ncbi:g9727 [Coccomyxa elongata]
MSYSVWAEPKGPVRQALEEEIRHLALAHRAPIFTPHITLLGGISGGYTEDVVLKKCEQMAEELQAAASARRAFGMDDALSEYMPHVSLIYSDIDQDTRRDIVEAEAERLGNEQGVLSQALPIDSITLWRTPVEDKTLKSWTLMKDFPLRKH